MWMIPGRVSGRKKTLLQKLFMMVELKRGLYTARSTVLAVLPAIVKDKSGEGDNSYDGVQPDLLQRGRTVMACRRSKAQEVRAVT